MVLGFANPLERYNSHDSVSADRLLDSNSIPVQCIATAVHSTLIVDLPVDLTDAAIMAAEETTTRQPPARNGKAIVSAPTEVKGPQASVADVRLLPQVNSGEACLRSKHTCLAELKVVCEAQPAYDDYASDSTEWLMTPLQEWMNALSMLAPTVVIVVFILMHKSHLQSFEMVMMASTLLHCPFSILFHTASALRKWPKIKTGYGVWNVTRKLDKTFIHVASIGFTLALSGSWLALNCAALANVAFIATLWLPDSTDISQLINIGFAVLIYLSPLLLRHDCDWENLVASICYFGVGSFFFILNTFGRLGASSQAFVQDF